MATGVEDRTKILKGTFAEKFRAARVVSVVRKIEEAPTQIPQCDC